MAYLLKLCWLRWKQKTTRM